jgi:hypothetical protein
MIVDLNEYEKAKAYLKSINDEELENITWVRDGKPIEVPDGAIEEYQFIGLNNTDFPKYIGASELGVSFTALLFTRKATNDKE